MLNNVTHTLLSYSKPNGNIHHIINKYLYLKSVLLLASKNKTYHILLLVHQIHLHSHPLHHISIVQERICLCLCSESPLCHMQSELKPIKNITKQLLLQPLTHKDLTLYKQHIIPNALVCIWSLYSVTFDKNNWDQLQDYTMGIIAPVCRRYFIVTVILVYRMAFCCLLYSNIFVIVAVVTVI